MRTILIGGREYRVVESLGFQPSAGGRVCIVKDAESTTGLSAAVRRGGLWRMWTAQDRLQPRGKVVGMARAKEPTKETGLDLQDIAECIEQEVGKRKWVQEQNWDDAERLMAENRARHREQRS